MFIWDKDGNEIEPPDSSSSDSEDNHHQDPQNNIFEYDFDGRLVAVIIEWDRRLPERWRIEEYPNRTYIYFSENLLVAFTRFMEALRDDEDDMPEEEVVELMAEIFLHIDEE